MLTLTYGHKKPQTGDKGSVFFPALEDNIDLDDAHTHNGSNSPTLDSSNIAATVLDVTSSSWTGTTWGYRKQVTFPGTYTRYNCVAEFFLEGGALGGNPIYPKVEYIGDTSFWLYMPVNNQALKVVFK